MRIHFIAIGGSAMHNLALALHESGNIISGSDDEILEPSRSRLLKAGLLPAKEGWLPENITKDIDAVILGMHASADNPELIKAKKLGLNIYSYPEYLYEHSKNKKRIVIGGSHGKTSITAMILHVMKHHNIQTDFMVGAQLDGFDTMVKITENAPFIILEGDEYLSSPIDRRPKFHLYHPHVALVSGIAWDHINVFPSFEDYINQFKIFIDLIEKDGTLIYCETDEHVKNLAEQSENTIEKIPYNIPEHEIKDGITYLLINENEKIPLQIFGEHNLLNLNGARLVCNKTGITDLQFYDAIQTFKGAANRLELVLKNDKITVFKDFAHSPSKVKATVHAVKQQHRDHKIIACMELHTFSSLNKEFLSQYKSSMDEADEAIVYYNPHTVLHKKLEPISEKQIKDAFGNVLLKVFTDSHLLKEHIIKTAAEKYIILMMSSGNFDGMNLEDM